MPTINLTIEVPVATCVKCGKEEPFIPIDIKLVNGTYNSRSIPPFDALILGRSAALVCGECKKFVVGAFDAMGIVMVDITKPTPV